ncbi:MAG: hypothetical protein R3A52_21035 [Polyangiales bacterium]
MDASRAVVVPAVFAAVFAVAAASPASLDPRPTEGLLVEQVMGVGDAALARVTLDDPARESQRAPPALAFTLSDASGAVVARTQSARSDARWATVAFPLSGRGPHTLRVEGQGARAVVPLRPPGALAFARDEGAMRAAEGALLPGREGEVLVRADGADAVSLESVMETVTVTPERAPVDRCGVASARVQVDGLGAPVTVVVARGALAQRTETRLPVVAGGVALSRAGEMVTLYGSDVGDAWALAGEAGRATRWSHVALRGEAGDTRGTFAAPAGARWVAAARGRGLDDLVALDVEVREGCDSPAMRRWRAAGAGRPALSVARVYDGGAVAVASRRARAVKVRRWALAGVALAVLALVAMVAAAGARRSAEDLRAVESRPGVRAWIVAASAALLSAVGVALALAALADGV